MTDRIASLTDRQRKVIRHSLDLFALAMVLIGLWLASGIHTMVPKEDIKTGYTVTVNA